MKLIQGLTISFLFTASVCGCRPERLLSNGDESGSGQGGGASGSAGAGNTPATEPAVVLPSVPGIPSVITASVDGLSITDVVAKGVTSGAEIIVTFSEEMDEASAEAAYSSPNAELSAENVTFRWDSPKVLAIVPNAALPYKAVDSSTAAPNAFSFSVAATARGRAGKPLSTGFSASFSTLKRVSALILPEVSNSSGDAYTSASAYTSGETRPSALSLVSGVCPWSDPLSSTNAATVAAALTALGYDSGAYYPSFPGNTSTKGPRVAIYSFRLDSIKEATLVSASFGVVKWERDPSYTSIPSANFSVDELDSKAISLATAKSIPLQSNLTNSSGNAYSNGYGTFTFDVTSNVTASLKNERTWSSFRLEFDGMTTGADSSVCSSASLRLEYLIE